MNSQMMPTKDEYDAYERVRKLGKYNMLDTRALQTSGLDYETYRFIMENYAEVDEMYGGGA
jgi:hypothetical protein